MAGSSACLPHRTAARINLSGAPFFTAFRRNRRTARPIPNEEFYDSMGYLPIVSPGAAMMRLYAGHAPDGFQCANARDKLTT
jgi:hypothetical protein